MITEKREKRILKMSFFSGLAFAIAEFIFAVYSHSQSALTDAVYDTAELAFIALLLFLTPLFYKPISEKHPFGYFQIETVFIIIKGIMMLSVTLGVSGEILHSALSGGNPVNNALIIPMYSWDSVLIGFYYYEAVEPQGFIANHTGGAFGLEDGYCVQLWYVVCLFPVALSGKDTSCLSCALFRPDCCCDCYDIYSSGKHEAFVESHQGYFSVFAGGGACGGNQGALLSDYGAIPIYTCLF